jgi:hypothetical protein
MPALPGRRDKAARRLTKDLSKHTLPAHNGVSSFNAIEPVHLIVASGQ